MSFDFILILGLSRGNVMGERCLVRKFLVGGIFIVVGLILVRVGIILKRGGRVIGVVY